MERDLHLNYFSLRKFSLLYAYYAIIDAPEYLADALFDQNKVRVRFGPEYSSPDYPYLVIFCKCRKKDQEAFEAAMDALPNKMLLCGYPGYVKFCESFMEKIRKRGAGSDEAVCSSV